MSIESTSLEETVRLKLDKTVRLNHLNKIKNK